MRTAKKTVPTLDLFRLAAVLLVVMNHTSPLADVSAMADFWLTRVLARVAVPFFLMTTGYFLSRNHWAGVGRQLKKLCLLYGVCILLYLPVNLYAGSFTGPADVLRKLLVDGTFYHLWYFPATILGIVIARWLSRLGLRVALPVAALLYLIGLGGDSYYGLVSRSRCFGPFTTAFLHCAAIPAMACSSRHCSFCLGPPEGGGTKSCLWRASSSLWQL